MLGGKVIRGKIAYKKEPLLILFLLAFTYAYFYHDSGWNGNSRFALTFAVVQEGTLAIDSFHDQQGTVTGDKSFFTGHYYSDKAVGTSVLATVFYLPIYCLEKILGHAFRLEFVKYLLTFFTIGLPSAIAGTLIYLMSEQLTGSKLQGYVTTVSITLGTMFFPFSMVFFGHQLSASILFCAFFMIFQIKTRPDLYTNGYLFVVGFLLAFSLITEYLAIVIVVLLIIYYFHVVWKEKSFRNIQSIAIPIVGGLIPVGILLAYNALCFGNPLSIGYQHLKDPFFQESMGQGLMGIHWPQSGNLFYLTVHPAMGLFWQSPVLIMALVGMYFMFQVKQYRVEALIVTIAFLGFLLINSGYYLWWGGWSFGPRHLIPAIPLLCLPLCFVPRSLLLFTIILGLFSVAQMFIVAASQVLTPEESIIRIAELGYFQYSSIYSYCLKQLLEGAYASNLGHQILGLENMESLLPVILAVVGVTSYFFIKRRDQVR
jgi:hypothetical protein